MKGLSNWQSNLSSAYASFPEATLQPVIGITGNFGEETCKLREDYYKAVVQAGGIPVIIPPVNDTDVIINTLEHIDGLLLSGGGDYNPLFCGEEPSPRLGGINCKRDLPELLITQLAYNRQLPILGICRGIQTLAIALGGKVSQDISDTAKVKHSQDADRGEPTHSINIEKESTLYHLFDQQETICVNSFHHQAVSDPGQRFRITARATDGIIEAMESREFKSIIGVQWHPECMGTDGQPLFRWLVRQANHYRQACEIHRRVLTLDTHCDTPMFFSEGIDFGSRDPKILVDLHKMSEGRQDATIMVAYLPQPKANESFASKVTQAVNTPTEYADLIFDEIEAIVEKNKEYLSIARTPADLYANKRQGRKSIMLGIENGLALNGRIENLRHFSERGIVYMTLCHNGDNDICDSARGSETHHGVSSFGKDVIREMNRLGIMVDLSHANEKSFYDALDISQTPIVCSHSSCRALCNHPRNLTDDQMRALAAKGGVMQITIYNGFLVENGEATVMDVLRHLEHAIQVMGIEHVGIGTDFDGDGGIRGFASSSEVINFTRQLMARNYSEEDIRKIWGGNFLRVMEQVQNMVK
jgi:microsomal dipeptidase-like Zn-dependent dipeptidase/gamma-glutamyl-gamma-aminobutyrate hydrolase PuuD